MNVKKTLEDIDCIKEDFQDAGKRIAELEQQLQQKEAVLERLRAALLYILKYPGIKEYIGSVLFNQSTNALMKSNQQETDDDGV